jgi:hypothetical protein
MHAVNTPTCALRGAQVQTPAWQRFHNGFNDKPVHRVDSKGGEQTTTGQHWRVFKALASAQRSGKLDVMTCTSDQFNSFLKAHYNDKKKEWGSVVSIWKQTFRRLGRSVTPGCPTDPQAHNPVVRCAATQHSPLSRACSPHTLTQSCPATPTAQGPA